MPTQSTTKQFTIANARKSDVSGIGRVHLQSTLETYPNRDAGIDKEWINTNLGFLAEIRGDNFRRRTVQRYESDPAHTLYLVVTNREGQIVGFFHCTRQIRQSRLEAIYLLNEVKGTGVADLLMKRGLNFAGNLPMLLEVVDYNKRAIRFYEKYGFKEVANSNKFVRNKLPIFRMKRKPIKEIKS